MASQKKSEKKNKKNTEPNPSYQRDLIECFKIGYSQLEGKSKDGKGSEADRLAVRENCRGSALDEKKK